MGGGVTKAKKSMLDSNHETCAAHLYLKVVQQVHCQTLNNLRMNEARKNCTGNVRVKSVVCLRAECFVTVCGDFVCVSAHALVYVNLNNNKPANALVSVLLL